MQGLFVDTPETLRCKLLTRALVAHGAPVAIAGPAGSGKSSCAAQVALSLDSDAFITHSLTFNALTTVAQTQEIISESLHRRGKGVLGPERGKTAVFVIDDLHAPAADASGTQRSQELLRSHLCHGGWCDDPALELHGSHVRHDDLLVINTDNLAPSSYIAEGHGLRVRRNLMRKLVVNLL